MDLHLGEPGTDGIAVDEQRSDQQEGGWAELLRHAQTPRRVLPHEQLLVFQRPP